MTWQEPVFDRTDEDVTKSLEYESIGWHYLTTGQKQEWLNRLKGALNSDDLNRIEENCRYIAVSLRIEGLVFKNWNLTHIFDFVNQQRVKGNLLKLKDMFIFTKDPGNFPTPYNSYVKINEIEKFLFDLYRSYLASIDIWGFITSDDKVFRVSDGGRFLVHGELEEIGFLVSNGDQLETREHDIFVSKEKIPII